MTGGPVQREIIDHRTVGKAVKTACMEGRRVVIRDAQVKAFALRVGPSGAISYTFQYRDAANVQRLYTLPTSECATPMQARAFAESLRDRVRDGSFDPLRDRRIGRERQIDEQRVGHTVAELCDAWLAARQDKRSLRSDRVLIKVHVKPKLGHLRVDEVTRRDIADAIRTIYPATYMANRFHALVTSLLSFAAHGVSGVEGLGWLPDGAANVAKGIARYPEAPREQNLSDEQLSRLLSVIERHQHTRTGHQIRLIMLTLARMSEVLGARWNEFALESEPAIWTKPAARMKAKKTVRLPIIGGALELLRRMKAEAKPVNEDAFVFPGRDHGHNTLKRHWYRLTAEAGLPDLHIHDLRHVGATVLASRGVPLFVIAKLLGHSNTSRVTERYSHLQDTAAADAMRAIGEHYRNVAAIGIEAAK
jgi:integrase